MGAKRDIKTMLFRFVLVAIYCVLGAAVFYCIEYTGTDNEEAIRKQRLYNETKRNITRRFGINDREYELLVANVLDAKSYTPLEWSFPKGLDLCMQIVTTIGYGNITPTTFGGQLFVIPFALFGVPLNVFLLTTVGQNLSHLILFIIDRFERKIIGRIEVENRELKSLIAIISFFTVLILFMAAVSTLENDWNFGLGLYVWFVTFSTIGFGDYIPGESTDAKSGIGVVMYRVIVMTLGLSMISTIFNTVEDFGEKRNSSALILCNSCISLRCCPKEGTSTEVHEPDLKNASEMETYSNKGMITENMKVNRMSFTI